ncbi:yjeF C-terminal region, hydroxyethylthiazole kinase-related/yjeF N-terminal region [Zhouia amylolytica]|uniref:Bifunctional NAD(P)H-hydrate repair enzyme n=1 Tax=Zhouia amylolytica TaxID=376730 RepID=A0A1I6T2F9_9FLAO|nr:bifunctional ADP-dependent NAD(P)H-hydrate dehydratase/NAD(P)H-hydrate epimerase [Zhouia amylolytica]MCQ0112676.1 bifunctional ADP-dependent NAD(P)H-hydrate dehydratase/NAD(P)H-hydrate epimerase [Zhouia amylolytica]SFS83228.1 yjeF C-terminal region, hydroxyethylthiazole kinase-related/yjeF N-terminal region [Zhouia amylolytica]
MKIFAADHVYAADEFTIKSQNISSNELMERASNQVFKWLDLRLQGAKAKLHVFSGVGNNGGDGLVIARLLLEKGYDVIVHIVNFSDNRSRDFLINLDRLKQLKYWPEAINTDSAYPEISTDAIVIDCIFGIGLNRSPEDWVGGLIAHINSSKAFVLSVDIPSGLYLDRVPDRKDFVIQANHTLTFQVPKLVFFLPETGVYTNQWELLNIGLDMNFLSSIETMMYLIGKHEVLPLYIPRQKFSHKGTYGHALIIGGSYGKIGAPLMTSEACLNTGAGLVTAFIPKCGYTIFQTSFPEAMVIADSNEESITNIKYEITPNVIAIGPGLGTNTTTINAFADFLKGNKVPLVIDADGLNILAEFPELIKLIPPKSVLTPHPKELQRLIGEWNDDFDKLEMVKRFSKNNDLIIVVKGAHTITVYQNQLYINNNGNPGMATAGSGDVLTGMITGLIAQGYNHLNAAVFGVYLHGKAGDLGVEKTGYQALTATTIIDFIGDAFLDLFIKEEPKKEGE